MSTNPLVNKNRYADPNASAPAWRALEVTPSDVTEFGENCRALYVGSGGNVHVETAGGDDITLANVQDGSIIPISVVKVLSTGTTAGSIVRLW